MSRSYCTYNEDWQRRKSVLIRSLFHDIPILSPVEEESNDSSHEYYAPTQEVFPSPPRPYSPLPPLIIEKISVTNKHDEPEEYYRKLHKKIKKIYEKLFIEKRNVNSVDFDSNYNNSSVNDGSEYNTGSVENLVNETENNSLENDNYESLIEYREARQSSASTNSNGYGADFESVDTAIIDVVNHTVLNEDTVMLSEEEQSENENMDKDVIRYEDFGNWRLSENKESSRERLADREFCEQVESQDSTIDDQRTTETEEPNEQSYETNGSDTEIIDEQEIIEEISLTRQTHTVIVDLGDGRGEEFHHSTISDQEITEHNKSYDKEGKQQAIFDYNSHTEISKSKEIEMGGVGGRHELIASNDELMEVDIESSQSSDGPHYRQITTAALIHFDGSQVPGDRESIVYEDSVKSVILPTRSIRMLAGRNAEVEDRIEVFTELEEKADPNAASTFESNENETTEEELEEVTSSYPDTTVNGDEMTYQPDAIEEDDAEIRAPESDASGRLFTVIDTHQTGAIDKDNEEICAHQSVYYSEEVDTNQPDAINKEIEERRNLVSGDIVEENETRHQPNEKFGEMRTPGLDTIEEDDENISTYQANKDVEIDIEEMSVHQPVANEETEAKRVSPLDEEISSTQRDSTDDSTLEKETTHPNTTDKEINTPSSKTNDEETRTSKTKVTEEEIEQMQTPRLKSIEKQMKNEVPESIVKDKNTYESADEDHEELESSHSIELMRTPRADISHGTIPITQRSYSTSSSDHTAFPQELTTMTLSTQNGADNNISELQTSNDINEILTSIFNESQNKDGTPISGSKRKLVDKSVQAVATSKVSWDEMRANFFVGTPKIFRLCACTNHICS